jgi:hypothetical protein
MNPSVPLTSSSQSVPVFADVDLLISGGTSWGCALALEMKRQGVSVFLCASRSFLGEDVAGCMRFRPEGELPASSLATRLYDKGQNAVTPMHLKLTLEQALVAETIPFLLNVHAAGVLRNPEGSIGGAVFVSRSGPIVIRARRTVDASMEGVLSALAGLATPGRPRGRRKVLHTTLQTTGSGVPDLEGSVADTAYAMFATTHELEVDFGEGGLRDMARAEAEIVERCWCPGEYQHQECIRLAEPMPELPAWRGPAAAGFTSLSPSVYSHPAFERPVETMAWAESLAGEILKTEPVPAENLSVSWNAAPRLPKGELRTLSDERRRQESDSDTILFPMDRAPRLERCDVLVLGGGTGGAPAAIAAARAGADVLVVEATDQLGGVGTAGQISVYWYGNRVGFTAEMDRAVMELEVSDVFKQGKGKWSVAAKSEWYHRESIRRGATLLFRSICSGVWVEHNRVRGALVATPWGFGLVEAGCVVDASGCADVAAAAAAPTVEVGAEHVAVQGTGLAGLQPGREYHNSDHTFTDDTDLLNTTAALVSGKLKFRDHFDAGQLIDSRERRQIVGDLVLGPVDLLANRRFPDTICVASSNFDSHGFTIHPIFMVKPPNHDPLWADVPLRALLPCGLERVLTTGLGVSCHRDALPVIRMQPDVQNQGYAAGYIAAISARENRDIREIDLKPVQRHLVEIGSLPARVLDDQDSFPLPDATLEDAASVQFDSLFGLACLFAEAPRSLPILRRRFAEETDTSIRLKIAEVLALLGDASGVELLLSDLRAREWDEGWNYRGMGQFGRSLSEMDVRLICVGRVASTDLWPVWLRLAAQLGAASEFSHFRALVESAEALMPRHPCAAVAEALAALLRLPGVSGHCQTSLQEVQAALSNDTNDNQPRNLALRELHLARGLYRCGDPEGLGREVLEGYARDLRGHFARHAKAVLLTATGS